MNTIDCLFYLAATGMIGEIKMLLPLVMVAAYSLTIEITLNKFEKTFSPSWWFFLSFALVIIANVTWSSWTASTPMADILGYGETSGQLLFAISAFLVVVLLLLLWLLYAGIKQISIEANGSGWGWALVRFSPLLPLAFLVVRSLERGNAAVGTDGLLSLVKM